MCALLRITCERMFVYWRARANNYQLIIINNVVYGLNAEQKPIDPIASAKVGTINFLAPRNRWTCVVANYLLLFAAADILFQSLCAHNYFNNCLNVIHEIWFNLNTRCKFKMFKKNATAPSKAWIDSHSKCYAQKNQSLADRLRINKMKLPTLETIVWCANREFDRLNKM